MGLSRFVAHPRAENFDAMAFALRALFGAIRRRRRTGLIERRMADDVSPRRLPFR